MNQSLYYQSSNLLHAHGNQHRNNYSNSQRRGNAFRLQKKKEQIFMLKTILATILFCLTFCIAVLKFTSHSNAEIMNEREVKISYTSVMIQQEDTLWSIAEEQTAHYPEVHLKDYISEVKRINGLSNNEIHYGEYLIIPVLSYQ